MATETYNEKEVLDPFLIRGAKSLKKSQSKWIISVREKKPIRWKAKTECKNSMHWEILT